MRLMRVLWTFFHHCLLAPLDPNRVNDWLDGRLVVCLEQHFFQAPAVKICQHTVDRMRLWTFAKHLTSSHRTVLSLYQHQDRGQAHVRVTSEESVDGSVAERLWESSVARPATHASHLLRNVACMTSCSSLSLSVGRTGALFTIVCLSSSTSTSPLSICLPPLDSCSTSGKRLDDCSSQGITYTHFCFRSSMKPRLTPNSFSIFLAYFTSRMNPHRHLSATLPDLGPSPVQQQRSVLSRFSRQTFLRFSEYQHPC